MVSPFAEDDQKKQSDEEKIKNEEKAKTLVNLVTIMTVFLLVSMAGYFYLSFALNWDPAIAIIPVLVVMISAGSYITWKILEISADAEKLPEGAPALPSQPALPGVGSLFAEAGENAKKEEKATAIRNLLLVVTVVDMVAIAGYLYCIFGMGWEPDKTIMPFLAVFFIPTGLYFAWKMDKIRNGS